MTTRQKPHGRSTTKTSGSKSHSSKTQASSSTGNPVDPTSFLFIVNELPTNDDPEVEGSVQARYDNLHWRPPIQSQGFFRQQAGDVYRWMDGVVSYATGYEWVYETIGDPVYANGTIRAGDIRPDYFSAATVFFCNHFDKFWATRGDVGTRDIEFCDEPEDGWYPLFFHHRGNNTNITSYVDHAGEHDFVAVQTATWIGQLLPTAYRRHSSHGANQGGLAGLLPLIIALVAFSCTDQHELSRVLVDDRSWRGHRWYPHERAHGRRERRGMVVTVFLDPDNPNGSTIDTIRLIEEGSTPIFR